MTPFASALALFVLAGCASIPSGGPSASDVVAEGVQTGAARDVFEIDERVLSILGRRTPDWSLTTFGDYRPSDELRMGVGDHVGITIWEAAAGGLFSAPLAADRFSTGSKSATIPDQAVARDGTITVPYAGRVRAEGRTAQQLQADIETALRDKAIQPQALVSVARPVSNAVTVLGEVANGARVPLTAKGDRVLDIIAAAGGVRAPINDSFIQITRGARSGRVAMTRVVADARENVFVRPGDVIAVLRDPQKFMVYGAAGQNAEIAFDAEAINLAQALSKAGGLLDHRADPEGVFVFRYERAAIVRALRGEGEAGPDGEVPTIYRLNMRKPHGLFLAQRFRIANRDLIYVANASLTDVQKVAQILSAVTQPAAASAQLYNVAR